MQIEMRRLDAVIPYPGNPRVNDAAIPAVVRSIKEFGFRNPILVDGDGVVIAGHTRLAAARKLNLETVPVVVAADLTPEQTRALRIADNQTASLADWDKDKLRAELAALADVDFDLTLLGFGDELDKLLPQGGEDDDSDEEERVPSTPTEPKSKPGELYALGSHRLLCGDSTDAEQVARLMGGVEVDLLLTDPPYGVAYVGSTEDKLTIENDDLPPEEFQPFLASAFRAADAVMKSGAPFYIWYADRIGDVFHAACDDAGWAIRQGLVWMKNGMVLGRQDYQWKHEVCLYGWKDGAARTWLADEPQSSVLRFDKSARNGEHPTMKPVGLFTRQIVNSCPAAGVVLDLFGGSGTVFIAAEKVGRRAYAMELSPKYADVIRRRWAEYVHGPSCDWVALTPAVPDTEAS